MKGHKIFSLTGAIISFVALLKNVFSENMALTIISCASLSLNLYFALREE